MFHNWGAGSRGVRSKINESESRLQPFSDLWAAPLSFLESGDQV